MIETHLQINFPGFMLGLQKVPDIYLEFTTLIYVALHWNVELGFIWSQVK